MSREGRSQSVNVERPPSVIAFRDASGFKVAVENLDQPGRNIEQRFVRRESESLFHSLSGLTVELDCRSVLSGLPSRCSSISQPIAKVSGKISPKGNRIALPVLLILRVERQEGSFGVEVEMP